MFPVLSHSFQNVRGEWIVAMADEEVAAEFAASINEREEATGLAARPMGEKTALNLRKPLKEDHHHLLIVNVPEQAEARGALTARLR